tara:strand:+ start:10484 stop:11458 length:975 start_codon:yes stop_codon:yes gene_type:complete
MCEVSKMPININSKTIEGRTYNENLLSLDYQDSICNVKNMCSYLLLPYDNTDNRQVIFDNKKYTLKNIKIFKPSLHKYDGIETEGEILLNHKGGKGSLKICVPLVKTSNKNNENNTLKEIFRHSISKAQCDGESITVHNIKLNANSFVPKSEGYYYYKTNNLMDEECKCVNNICGEETNVIVYHKNDGYVGISDDSTVALDKLINKHNHTIKEATYKYNVKQIKEGFEKRNELYDAVYKGDVEELIDVIGGKKKVNKTIMSRNVLKWFQKHIFDYLYYLSGVIVVLAYIISTQTTVNENDANEAAAMLSANFDKAAVRAAMKSK